MFMFQESKFSFVVFQQHLEARLRQRGKDYVVVLMSEVFPARLALFDDVEA
jgi:2-(3-amino-3-carboxypropyl)histidine synthase